MGTCPNFIQRLIDRFDQQADQVLSPDYNETQLRIDFVNPLCHALGWDVDNSQGYAEQYREVVHEDRVKIAGQTKAPDYSFRVGGTRKFFLEAKKPHVNIGAYQFLLDWHLTQYLSMDPAKLATGKNPVLRPGPTGDYRLTIAERKRILLDNIHGVDLDSAAVEVTKLNLLLKCLEGETRETLGFTQRLSANAPCPISVTTSSAATASSAPISWPPIRGNK